MDKNGNYEPWRPRIEFIKTHSDAKLPTQAHSDWKTGDTGYDLSSVEDVVIPARGSAVVPVGLKLAFIESGYWFKIEGRSGLGFKQGIQPHFGIVDNGYRGDLGVKLYNLTDVDVNLPKGKAIAQMVFYPLVQVQMQFTEQARDSTRGENGFGSSDAPKYDHRACEKAWDLTPPTPFGHRYQSDTQPR